MLYNLSCSGFKKSKRCGSNIFDAFGENRDNLLIKSFNVKFSLFKSFKNKFKCGHKFAIFFISPSFAELNNCFIVALFLF